MRRFNTFRHVAVAIASLLLILWSPSASANLIVNGSYESPFDEVHWTGNYITAGSSAGYHPNTATDGSYIAGFGGGATPTPPPGYISQEFPTSPGQQYDLEFDYGVYGSPVAQSMQVSVVGQSTVLDVVVSHTSNIGHTTPDAIHSWQTQTFVFTADSALSTLRFFDVSTSGLSTDSALDRISIAAVPEPSTALLIGLGLSALAVRREKR
mgnify:CR=1 FL=1